MKRKDWLLIFLILLVPSAFLGQDLQGRVGIVAVLGHPVTRMGLMGELSLTGEIYQVFTGAGLHYNFRQYGPPAKGWELQSRLGFALGFGPPEHRPGFVPRTYVAGYTLNSYLDQIKTSQFTGAFLFQGGPVSFEMENDAFSLIHPGDQFRTGAFRLGFIRGDWQAEGVVALWHGQTKGEGINRQQLPSYPGRWGFRDMSGGLYGNYSNGVAMLRVSKALPYGQQVFAALGVDAEQVRHFFQNHLIHDLRFFPAKWTTVRNPHYPMLDTEGCPYLYLEGQEVRRARIVWQIGSYNHLPNHSNIVRCHKTAF